MNLTEFVNWSKHSTMDPTQWVRVEADFWNEHQNAINEALAEDMREHVWEEGVGLFVWRRKMLPTAHELSVEMFDEWDDPVSDEQSDLYLTILKRITAIESA
jgi:hypothetical protein